MECNVIWNVIINLIIYYEYSQNYMGICNCKQLYQVVQLRKCTNDMPLFSFENIQCYAKIVDVYDGDTFKACIYHRNRIIKINCRTLGYDSPEIKPRLNITNREAHIEEAKQAREYFKDLINYPDGLVYLNCHKYDKYGRVLVTVYQHMCNKTKSVNDMMIEAGHGYRYNGGAKRPLT